MSAIVSIAEEHDGHREILAMLLQGVPRIGCIAQYRDAEKSLRRSSCRPPDVGLMDVKFPCK